MSVVLMGIAAGVWFVVCLIVIAACWAAHRGDEELQTHRPDSGSEPRTLRAETHAGGVSRQPLP